MSTRRSVFLARGERISQCCVLRTDDVLMLEVFDVSSGERLLHAASDLRAYYRPLWFSEDHTELLLATEHSFGGETAFYSWKLEAGATPVLLRTTRERLVFSSPKRLCALVSVAPTGSVVRCETHTREQLAHFELDGLLWNERNTVALSPSATMFAFSFFDESAHWRGVWIARSRNSSLVRVSTTPTTQLLVTDEGTLWCVDADGLRVYPNDTAAAYVSTGGSGRVVAVSEEGDAVLCVSEAKLGPVVRAYDREGKIAVNARSWSRASLEVSPAGSSVSVMDSVTRTLKHVPLS